MLLLVSKSYVIFILLIEYWNKLTLHFLRVLYFLKIFYFDMAHVYCLLLTTLQLVGTLPLILILIQDCSFIGPTKCTYGINIVTVFHYSACLGI
jgi:hypothetical protein